MTNVKAIVELGDEMVKYEFKINNYGTIDMFVGGMFMDTLQDITINKNLKNTVTQLFKAWNVYYEFL